MSDPFALDKARIRASFDRAAATYDEAAVLQKEVAARMVARLEVVNLRPRTILDLGCGTGHAALHLRERYPEAVLCGLDLAPAMLERARGRAAGLWPVCGDVERLPFADGCADLVLSNLTLQWLADPAGAFREFRRVLRPGGLLMFTSLGPDTLKELRAAWAAVDGAVHVNRFLDMHDLGDALVHSGWAEPVLDLQHFTLTYRELGGLMRDLKAIGAHNVAAGRPRGLTGRRRLQAVAAAYERFRSGAGVLPATYEVVYGHAWKPSTERPLREPKGPETFPLERLRRGWR